MSDLTTRLLAMEAVTANADAETLSEAADRIAELEAALGETEDVLSKSLKFWRKMAFSGTSSLAQKMEVALATIRKAREGKQERKD